MTADYISQQPSPASSASPTSPRIHDYLQQQAPNPYKQLRPLKSPLYVPAVLRPTEHFSSPAPLTPPKSLHGSLDNLQDNEPPAASPEEQTMDFGTFDPEWAHEEDLGEVTGPPTRDHWKVSSVPFIPSFPVCGHDSNLLGLGQTAMHETCGQMCANFASLCSPMKLHQAVTRHSVGRRSTSLFANITAAIVAISSVLRT